MATINVTGGNAGISDAKRSARTVAQTYASVMADLTTNWSGLTSAAKLEAVRVGVVLALRILRYLWLKTGENSIK